MVSYRIGTTDLTVHHLLGFFDGWPVAPSPETHLAALQGCHLVVTAWDAGRLVGRLNVISDGVAAAFIPWLEVVPQWRGRGIGAALVRRALTECGSMYSLDLVCDADLGSYYRALGFQELVGMGRRNPSALR